MKNIVQFSRLGTFGRFGNQLFQYVFSRAFAERYNAVLEIPENWIGRKIFKNINHPSISSVLPRTKIDEIPNRTNIDLFGYYQSVESLKILSILKIKQWLQIEDKWLKLCKKEKDFYIACHVRRGDYLTKFNNHFCIIDEKSYLSFCKRKEYNLADIVWVKEEYPHYNEVLNKEGMDFLLDFMILLNANILLRSNSTFSYWAGLLGNSQVFSPIVKNKVGENMVDFSEGNWEPLYDKKYHKNITGTFNSLLIN